MQRQVTWNPKSLFKTCLELIAYRVKDYNPNAQVTSSSNPVEDVKSVSKCAINPFDELPTYFLEQIIDVIRSKGWLKINNYQDLWVAANTRKLDISGPWSFDDESTLVLFLELAAIRCPRLTSLYMNSVKFSAEYFEKFLPTFKDLQELEVSWSMFNNCCLHIVGEYCRNLLKLNVTGCYEITDDGIESLCGGESACGKEMPLGKSGQCKSIQELLINGTQVTHKGVQMALRYLPHLKKFDGLHNVVQSLAAMHRHQTNSILPSEYSLTHLNVFSDYSSSSPLFFPYKNGDLPLAVTLCPFVTSVHISWGVGINDSDILGLIGLKHLNKLSIVASRSARESRFTFDGGLLPFLKATGSVLKYLEFSHFYFLDQSVRLASLVEYCPNLEHLSLATCEYSLSTGVEEGELMAGRVNTRMKPDFPWKHLKKLELKCFFAEIPTELLFLVLSSSPVLEELFISGCSTLDDELVRRVFGYHSFGHLQELHLDCCDSITMRGVQWFRNIGMDWDHLRIEDCISCDI